MWIEIHTELKNHWKIEKLAKELDVPYTQALGSIISLWLFCAEQAKDGNLKKFEAWQICGIMRIKNLETVKNILMSCELLDKDFKVHDWKKYGIKFLESNRRRKEKYNRNVPRTFQERSENVTGTGKERLPYHTLPNHTIPKKKKEETPTQTLPQNGEGLVSVVSKTESKNGEKAPLANEEYKAKTPLQYCVIGWKCVTGVPPDDREWDKLNWGRTARSAKELLEFFGGQYKIVVNCMEDVFNELNEKGLSCTIETVKKRAYEWRDKNAKDGSDKSASNN